MKKTPHQLRLDEDVDGEVKKIADATGLSQIEVMRQMVVAGVKVIKANGYKLTLPLNLELAKEAEAQSSPGQPVVSAPAALTGRQSNSPAKKEGKAEDILDVVEKHHPSKPFRRK